MKDADRLLRGAEAVPRAASRRLVEMQGQPLTATQGGDRWIIDPLDGTVNYASGLIHEALPACLRGVEAV